MASATTMAEAPLTSTPDKSEITASEEYLQIGKTAHMLLLGEFDDEFPDAEDMLKNAASVEERIGVLAQFANFWIAKTPEIDDNMPVPPTIQVSKQICMQFVQQTLTTASTYDITPVQLTAYMAAHSEATVESDTEESNGSNANDGRTKCARKSARRRANRKAALAEEMGKSTVVDSVKSDTEDEVNSDMPPVIDDLNNTNIAE